MSKKTAKRDRLAALYGHKVNDATKILRYLADNDHITRVQALGLFRIHNATARITELRQQGWRINTEERFDVTGKRYARWSLHPDDRELVRHFFLKVAA